MKKADYSKIAPFYDKGRSLSKCNEVRAQTSGSTERWLANAGFVNVTSRKIIQQTFNAGSERLNAAWVKNTSVLNMISKEAFESGMNRFTEDVDRNPDDRWLLFDQMTLTVGNKE